MTERLTYFAIGFLGAVLSGWISRSLRERRRIKDEKMLRGIK